MPAPEHNAPGCRTRLWLSSCSTLGRVALQLLRRTNIHQAIEIWSIWRWNHGQQLSFYHTWVSQASCSTIAVLMPVRSDNDSDKASDAHATAGVLRLAWFYGCASVVSCSSWSRRRFHRECSRCFPLLPYWFGATLQPQRGYPICGGLWFRIIISSTSKLGDGLSSNPRTEIKDAAVKTMSIEKELRRILITVKAGW